MEHSCRVLPAERRGAAGADRRQPGESRAVPGPERRHRAIRLSLRLVNASCAATLTRDADHWVGRFVAMACPCEVLIEDAPSPLARAGARHRRGARHGASSASSAATAPTASFIGSTRSPAARPWSTRSRANLLDFAATLTRLSEGAFDITSGVLRKAWTFDGGDRVPSQAQIDALLESVGWHRVEWRRPLLKLQAGMQIDLGGIGKEYAVDAAASLVETIAPGLSCLINFGGDVAVRNARHDGKPWRVGIESCARVGARRAHRATVTRCARYQRRFAALRVARRSSLLAHSGRAHWLAGAQCAAFHHGRGRHLHAGGHAHNVGDASGRKRRAHAAGERPAVLAAVAPRAFRGRIVAVPRSCMAGRIAPGLRTVMHEHVVERDCHREQIREHADRIVLAPDEVAEQHTLPRMLMVQNRPGNIGRPCLRVAAICTSQRPANRNTPR